MLLYSVLVAQEITFKVSYQSFIVESGVMWNNAYYFKTRQNKTLGRKLFSPKIEECSSYLLHPSESVDYTLAPQTNSLAEKKHQHGEKTK